MHVKKLSILDYLVAWCDTVLFRGELACKFRGYPFKKLKFHSFLNDRSEKFLKVSASSLQPLPCELACLEGESQPPPELAQSRFP